MIFFKILDLIKFILKRSFLKLESYLALGTKNDNFVVCPPEALDWSSRRWRLLEEIIRYQPDIMCLQVRINFILNYEIPSHRYPPHV